MAAADLELLTKLIALDKGVSNAKAAFLLRLASSNDENDLEDGAYDIPYFDHDMARKFIEWITGYEPFLVATFLYIYMCDELAVGIIKIDTLEQPEYIQRMYGWVLEFEPLE